MILEEKTTSGTEVFPVVRVDSTVRSHAHGTSSVLADLLLDPGIGVDEDEDSFPVVLADEDFEVVGDDVVVGDVVHASIVLRKWQGVKGFSVIFRENPASGAEIFPVIWGDRGLVDGADRTSTVLGDLLSFARMGVDDEHSTTILVFIDADFEVVVDDVVVDDVVHACIVPRKWQGVNR